MLLYTYVLGELDFFAFKSIMIAVWNNTAMEL